MTKIEKSEPTTLKCLGCGKIGFSICPRCAKSKGRIVAARAYPLKERDPELYKRLDDLSQRPLEDNKQLWDEFCVEIGAGQYYEYLPVLKKILDEGLWRTDAQYPVCWIRENLARQVKKLCGQDDFQPDGRRRPSRPKFDKRSGALVTPGIQPFAEFECSNSDGGEVTSLAVVEGEIARKQLRSAEDDDECVVMPSDAESHRRLGRMTTTEREEYDACLVNAEVLRNDKREFDSVLALVIKQQSALAATIGLDADEAEVFAISGLLWAVGPRMYLRFVNESERKRLRNAFDRIDRKKKEPEWKRRAKQLLRESAIQTRTRWARSY